MAHWSSCEADESLFACMSSRKMVDRNLGIAQRAVIGATFSAEPGGQQIEAMAPHIEKKLPAKLQRVENGNIRQRQSASDGGTAKKAQIEAGVVD